MKIKIINVGNKLNKWESDGIGYYQKQLPKNIKISFINLKDSSKIAFNPSKVVKKSISLDYNNLVEGKRNALNEGEFALHPMIKLSYAKGRLTTVSKELMVDITLNIYEGPYYKVLDSLNYKFSLYHDRIQWKKIC